MKISKQVSDQFIYNIMRIMENGGEFHSDNTTSICKELEELGLCKILNYNYFPHITAILTPEGVDVMNHLNPKRPSSENRLLQNRAEGVTRLICETFNVKLGKNQKKDMASLIFKSMTSP